MVTGSKTSPGVSRVCFPIHSYCSSC